MARKAVALQSGEFIVLTAVVWLTALEELDHIPESVVEQLVMIGAAEYVDKPKKIYKKPGPTEFKNE